VTLTNPDRRVKPPALNAAGLSRPLRRIAKNPSREPNDRRTSPGRLAGEEAVVT
jgi:hypothetical protein